MSSTRYIKEIQRGEINRRVPQRFWVGTLWEEAYYYVIFVFKKIQGYVTSGRISFRIVKKYFMNSQHNRVSDHDHIDKVV